MRGLLPEDELEDSQLDLGVVVFALLSLVKVLNGVLTSPSFIQLTSPLSSESESGRGTSLL